MPPRYAYWTIIVDGQPTAFRAAMQEDLMPTFKRLKHKHPSAEMKWFQNGKLWNSRTDAQEAMLVRGERGRAGDTRQGGGFKDRKRSDRPVPRERPEWKPKPQVPGPKPSRSNLEWKPKGEFTPAPKRDFKTSRPEWKPKGTFDRDRKPDWKPKGSFDRERKPEWKPKGEKRKWIPKEEYKRSKGISTPRDSKWRPGGEHKDPRQKYKDAKKAKWTKFKKTVRTRWESKQRPKKKDE
jgi:hypothetical protein